MYGHDANDSGADVCANDSASRQDISTPFSILITFEATECSYSIRFDIQFVFNILRIFDSDEIPDSSHPYCIFSMMTIVCSSTSEYRTIIHFNAPFDPNVIPVNML